VVPLQIINVGALERRVQAHSCNHYCNGKAIRVTSSENVFVALCVYHAMLMRQLSSVVCPALFNIFSYTALCRKKLLNIKCVFLLFYLQLVSETFLILRRNERDIMKSILVFMQSNHSSCQILMKLLFS